jgi:putative FmdB family regulatory protein
LRAAFAASTPPTATMPIYAYRCESCGHAKDVLQKISDDPLTVCPACGAPTFRKQVTAAGFQLKGSGWYVTDFRNNGSDKPATASKESGGAGTASDGDKSASAAPEKGTEKATEKAVDKSSSPAAAPAASSPAASSPPAGGGSTS